MTQSTDGELMRNCSSRLRMELEVDHFKDVQTHLGYRTQPAMPAATACWRCRQVGQTPQHAALLVEAGVDVLAIDTAHGPFRGSLRRSFRPVPGLALIAGNVVAAATEALIEAGRPSRSASSLAPSPRLHWPGQALQARPSECARSRIHRRPDHRGCWHQGLWVSPRRSPPGGYCDGGLAAAEQPGHR